MQLGFAFDVGLMVGAQRKCNAQARARYESRTSHVRIGAGGASPRVMSSFLQKIILKSIKFENIPEHSGFMIIADLSFNMHI